MDNKTMLVFAPHPDDEVLGVGGTISKRAKQGWRVVDCIVTFDKDYEIRKKEALEANKELGISETIFLGFTDLQLDRLDHSIFTQSILNVDISSSIKDKINALKKHESQIEMFPCSRSEEAVNALAIYRGSQASMVRAEAFSLIRRYER